jgi:hypothetical protein
MGTLKDFFEIYSQCGHAPSKRFTSPALDYVVTVILWTLFPLLAAYFHSTCYTDKMRHNYTHNRAYDYSFFTLRIELHAARMQTKLCRSCSHHVKGWAGLSCAVCMIATITSTILHLRETAASNGTICHSAGDIWARINGGIIPRRHNRSTWCQTRASATVTTTNPIRTALRLNLDVYCKGKDKEVKLTLEQAMKA